MEEWRVRREVDWLKVQQQPFATRTRFISKNAKMRILEDMRDHLGLPHARFITSPDLRDVRMPGWRTTLNSMYVYYQKLTPGESSALDFMFDSAGIEKLDDVPLDVQMGLVPQLLRLNRTIDWYKMSDVLVRRLMERLAEEAEIDHPRLINSGHMNEVVIPEIGCTLQNMYSHFCNAFKGRRGRVIDLILDKVNVEKLDLSSAPDRIFIKKSLPRFSWADIPLKLQLKYLKDVFVKAQNTRGMKCPHMRALTTSNLNAQIPELEVSAEAMLNYYRPMMPGDYPGPAVHFMLDSVGVKRLADLPFDVQCRCIQYNHQLPWLVVPKPTIKKLLSILRSKVDKDGHVPHLRFLRMHHLYDNYLEEIGASLAGLHQSFRSRQKKSDKRETIDIILDHCGVERLDELPFSLQIGWTASEFGPKWGRVPDEVIKHWLWSLVPGARTRQGRISSPLDLKRKQFMQRLPGKEGNFEGLFDHLVFRFALPHNRGPILRGAPTEFQLFLTQLDLPVTLLAKRYEKFELLDQNEKDYLIRSAKLGVPEAMGHLLYFYRPLIAFCAQSARVRLKKYYLNFDELEQIGRIKFVRLVATFNARLSAFETYIRNYLTLQIIDEVFRKEMIRPDNVESLETPVFEGEPDYTVEKRVKDQIIPRPDAELESREMTEKIYLAVNGSGLTRREKAIVMKRLGDKTLEEIGMGFRPRISRERVRQILDAAIGKIRSGPFAEVLREMYFDSFE